jgi:hypothetical protein
MTMFIKLENDVPVGYPIIEDNFRYLFPDQFPNPHVFIPNDVEPLGYGMYEFTQIPTAEYPMKLVETAPMKRSDGIYYQSWNIVEMNDEEQVHATTIKEIEVRNQRNFNLFQSDWTQFPDVPLTEREKSVWTVYRQELRDMPNQEGFPWNIIFPNHPNLILEQEKTNA